MTAIALALRLLLQDARSNPAILDEYRIASAVAIARHGAEVVRIAHVESRFDLYAVGAKGEIGAMQILPVNARPGEICGDLVVADSSQNIECARRLIARAKRQCPRYWQSRYNGRPCARSRYWKATS